MEISDPLERTESEFYAAVETGRNIASDLHRDDVRKIAQIACDHVDLSYQQVTKRTDEEFQQTLQQVFETSETSRSILAQYIGPNSTRVQLYGLLQGVFDFYYDQQ
jgi:hypothetical protein